MPGLRMVRGRGDEVLPPGRRLPAQSGPHPAVESANVLPDCSRKLLKSKGLARCKTFEQKCLQPGRGMGY